jgi:hypothetical protein
MPRRFLLSAEQRTRLFAIPVDHAEMAKHYVLSAGTQRSAHGRSGTAPFRNCAVPALRGCGIIRSPRHPPTFSNCSAGSNTHGL